jgi:hypothetical protein
MATKGSLFLGLMLLLTACRQDDDGLLFPAPEQATGFAVAYGVWTPGVHDSCSKAIHDGYSVVGPDGIVYPTWHPPVDPISGCTFGHEHGRDPAGSDLFSITGKIPFGYANQHLEESGFGSVRNEDHVGHKVEWENDIEMRAGEGGDAVFAVRCDVLVKMHQGTHSPDAFTNNMHEIAYHLRCTDGTGFSATLLTPIGRAGELRASCDGNRHIRAGTATPANSPDGGGVRIIPDMACVQTRLLRADGTAASSDFDALRENWEVHARIVRDDGRTLASFDPYFQVLDPSRFFDPNAERKMGRTVDLCFGTMRARGGPCREVEGMTTVAWDDPRSPFKGVRRFVDINGNRIDNRSGGELWYTDPLGRRASPLPFAGSIVQWIAKRDNNPYDLHGPPIGRDRSYNAKGVHAPG